ncbi:carboxypeptidase-like regulatory domain-containing protein [Myxococcota bacterium]|nr:carboxypeptidase-like regulatory domain-containing protein [Myxococcota bacterium]
MFALTFFFTSAFGAELEGVVHDASGAPLAGVRVVAYDERLNYAVATTTSSGRYSLTVPAGRYRLRAVPPDESPSAQRFWPDAWSFCDGEILTLTEDERREEITFSLVEGGVIRGALVDDDGAPVVGATVRCVGDDARSAYTSREAVSDEAGAFTLRGLDADPTIAADYALRVEAEGFPNQYPGPTYDEAESPRVSLSLGETVDLGALTLLSGLTLSGVVEGPDGPIPDATVWAYAEGQVVSTITDAEGRYVAAAVPPGPALTWASASGYARSYWPGQDRPADARIEGAEEGATLDAGALWLPRESALVLSLSGLGGDLSGITGLLYNDTRTVGVGAQADSDGTLRLEGLWGGDYTLYVYAEDEGGQADWLRDGSGDPQVFTLSDGEELAEDLTLPRGGAIEATLTDDGGAPAYGAELWAYPEDPDGLPLVAEADAEGQLTLRGLDGGRVRLEARRSAFCPNDPGLVTVWWPGEVNDARASWVTVAPGEVMTLSLTLPRDDDHDGMSDAWEDTNGLDVGRDDGDEDADNDGFTNLDEYLLGTDPRSAPPTDTGRCGGCGGEPGGAAALVGVGLTLRRRRRGGT